MKQHKPQAADSAKPPYLWRVPIIYALLGGPLGAWLLAVYLWLQNGRLSQTSFSVIIGDMWEITSLGYVFGGIPMLLTGLLSMRLHLRRTVKGIACMVAIGAVVLLLWLVLIHWNVSKLYQRPEVALMRLAVVMVCGAASSLVLSVFLPKPQPQ